MNLLAVDTSTTACSVALRYRERVFERHAVQAREHTQLLVPMIRDVLAEGGVALANLDAIVLGNGPGSFIGMRISASLVQGLAFGAQLRLVPVSSLAAIAAEAFLDSDVENLLVTQDAHMNEVYLERFTRDERGQPVSEGEAVLQTIGCFSVPGPVRRWHGAGDGWNRYPDLLRLNEWISELLPPEFPRARFLLDPGEAAFVAGKDVEPGQLVPAYVRSRVAAEPAGKPIRPR